MPSFANQVILITGAGSGIGRHLALTLAREGAAIAAVDLQAEPLAALAGELSGQRHAWAVADVTNRAAVHLAVAELGAGLGPIDVLIACAGIGLETSALAFQGDVVASIIRVNLIGVVNSIDAVLPEMLARRHGHLVALSSLASFRGLPRMAAYCASKAGVNALMDSLRVDLKSQGIAVTTICPGWIRTPMTTAIDAPMPDMLELEDAVQRIIKAIRGRRSLFAFPRSSAFKVRLLRWLPPGMSDWLLGKMQKQIEKKSKLKKV
jgi:NAD(P)-dependent dehydrogenase (short-subunit alcohol dehydrogenase family)